MFIRERLVLWLPRLVYVPLALGAIATILFFSQGGFGGGHSDFDGVIVTLMLPGVLLLSFIPLPGPVLHYDYLPIIALPTVVNMMLAWAVARIVLRLGRGSDGHY
jgi:hypothetical protein